MIVANLINEGVQAVILTSTWGTGTRCGATMVNEPESVGVLTVHICSIVSISKTVGAHRIVPSMAIPLPLGDPAKSPAEELAIRHALVEKALEAQETEPSEQQVW